jgi:hypothetical protein
MSANYVDFIREARVRQRTLEDFKTIKSLRNELANATDEQQATTIRVQLAKAEKATGEWFFENCLSRYMSKETASNAPAEDKVKLGFEAFKCCAFLVRNPQANPAYAGTGEETASEGSSERGAFVQDAVLRGLNIFDKKLLGG